jgi:hypothetical protein
LTVVLRILHNAIFFPLFPIVKPGAGAKAYTFIANARRELAAGVATRAP